MSGEICWKAEVMVGLLAGSGRNKLERENGGESRMEGLGGIGWNVGMSWRD